MRQIVSLLVLLLLCACTPERSIQIEQDGKVTATTPYQLRAVPQAELVLRLSIDDWKQTYNGSDFPDRTWRIDITDNVEADQTYDLMLEWYHGELLLLEESGQIQIVAGSPQIQPDLDFLSTGLPRLDLDCDGYSNLDEINNGTDPMVVDFLDPNDTYDSQHCGKPSQAGTLTGSQEAKLKRMYSFREQPTKKYEQALQVRESGNDRSTEIAASIVGITADETDSNSYRSTVQLSYNEQAGMGRTASFVFAGAVDATPSTLSGASCKKEDIYHDSFFVPTFDTVPGYRCVIPYEWKDKKWYTLTIENTTNQTWTATIVDQETGQSENIGSMSLDAGLDMLWFESSVATNFSDAFHISGCNESPELIPPLHIHYRSAVFDSTINADFQATFTSDCLKHSGNWNYSFRELQTGLLYALRIGLVE